MISKYLLAPLFIGICLSAAAQDAITSVQPPAPFEQPRATPSVTPSVYSTEPAATPAGQGVETVPPPDAMTPAAPLAQPPDVLTPQPETQPAAGPAEAGAAPDSMAPSWDTQKAARTYVLQIPAPRGQITDRQGRPLAQTRVSYNLALNFPVAPALSDAQAVEFAHDQVTYARGILARDIMISDDAVLKH
jgi:hypothetical protein